jgi:hypothetical protein
MRMHRALRVAACGIWVLGSGCTALREIPRADYTARSQRDRVRVVTQEGLVYEFDYASFSGDSLTGFRRRDIESKVEEFATIGFPLGEVKALWVRGIDWTRTALVGGGALLGVVGLALAKKAQDSSGTSSGGGTIRPPPG